MIKSITRITEGECRTILESGYGVATFEPRGLFLVRLGWRSWAALDNHSGDAWFELFRSKRKAIRWLRGGHVRNANGWQV